MTPEDSFPENWSPPRELSRALPREIRMTGNGRFLTVFSALLLLAALALCVFLRSQIANDSLRKQALKEQGVSATGAIYRLWREGKENTPMVGYEFSAGQVRMRGQSSVPDSLWPQVQKEGMMPIRYLPSDPSVNHPTEWEPDIPPAWMPYGVPAIFLIPIAILFAIRRKQANLLAEGTPGPGVVTSCRFFKGGYSTRYRFRARDGAILSGSGKVRRKMDVGQTVCILYDPENPRRNAIYPMDYYRLA